MRFSITLLVGALATLVSAQNAFNIPKAGTYVGLVAGSPTTFTWSDKKGATVTMKLRTGDRSALSAGTVIANSIPNTGSFTWNIPSSTVEGANYAIEIINDDDPSETNYTGQFVITSKVLAVPTKSSASKSASASASGSPSSGASTKSGASSSSKASASAKTTGTASKSASGSTTGTSKASKASKTGASKTTSSADKSKTTAAQQSAVPTNNSAPMVKVGGSLLAVALGFAFAL